MTPEELLKPRWKVIADYPNSIFKVGGILTSNNGGRIYCDPDSVTYDDFPHIFKSLQWWEERNDDEYPKYVRGIMGHAQGYCNIVADPDQNGRVWHVDGEIEHRHVKRFGSFYVPITEQEYIQWKEKQHTNHEKI